MSDNPALYREMWERKPVLRTIYTDLYHRIMNETAAGRTLEIGGGSGNLKSFSPDVISSDIMHASWLDVQCDAQQLPFSDSSFSNVVMVDVLHHIEHPIRALREIARVLRPGGRLLFCEPAITPLSGLFYRNFHPEPVDMSADPLASGPITPGKDPWISNQAIPTLLVTKFRDALRAELPDLAPLRTEWFSFLAYPLSGGFRPWSLLPAPIARPLLAAEWSIRKLLGKLAAFRLLASYEKRA